MSTRGIIRTQVRHNLGEMREGTWKDADLNYFIEEACTEHSSRAYSNKVKRFASSIKYVQDYAFSPDFGELSSIRYYDEDGGDRELDYVTRAILRDWGYRGTELGRACAYYREQDSFGLFPIPEKKVLLACPVTDNCHFTPILVDRSASPIEMFRRDFSLQIVNDEVVENDGLDPACVYIGQVGVYLRRKGRYYPGYLTLSIEDTESGYVHESEPIRAETINARPDWVVFDFTHNPIEAHTENVEFIFRLFGDAMYQDADPEEYGGVGVEVGTDPDTENAYMELHRLRNDIEVEYYRNKVDPLLHDDQKLEIPPRYHHTIVKMTVSKAYAKGNYNLPASREWRLDADDEIKRAKAQAIIPTLGRRSEMRTSGRLLPNIQHRGNGSFHIRFGGYLG